MHDALEECWQGRAVSLLFFCGAVPSPSSFLIREDKLEPFLEWSSDHLLPVPSQGTGPGEGLGAWLRAGGHQAQACPREPSSWDGATAATSSPAAFTHECRGDWSLSPPSFPGLFILRGLVNGNSVSVTWILCGWLYLGCRLWLGVGFSWRYDYLILRLLGSISAQKQGSASSFCKESESKYFRLLQTTSSLLQWLNSAVVAGKQHRRYRNE